MEEERRIEKRERENERKTEGLRGRKGERKGGEGRGWLEELLEVHPES